MSDWRPMSAAPKGSPIIAQHHEFDNPDRPLREHVVWFYGGAFRIFPSTEGLALADRWRPIMDDAPPARWRARVDELLETTSRYLQRARDAEAALKAALAANDNPFDQSELRYLRDLAEGGAGGTKPGGGFSAQGVLTLRAKLNGMVR